jgi:hypothetical protein
MGNKDEELTEIIWNERNKAYERLFGPIPDHIYHAVKPLFLGGFADVWEFPPTEKRKDWLYVTADLSDPFDGKSPNQNGTIGYGAELMIRASAKNTEFVNLISRLARYIADGNIIEWGHSMGPGDFFPGDTALKGLLYAQPKDHDPFFEILGGRAKFLLLIGVTKDELEWAQSLDTETDSFLGAGLLIGLLLQYHYAPTTDNNRTSIFNDPERKKFADKLATYAKQTRKNK